METTIDDELKEFYNKWYIRFIVWFYDTFGV
jgi:hypothetical protein